MRWTDVLAGMNVVASGGSDVVDVTGVQYDSRRVGAGDLFVAMRGGSTDGNRYVEKAIAQGAVAVVTDSAEVFAALGAERPGLAIALVEQGRRALAEASAAVFGHPERALKLCGVTGTNGKTTTTFLLEQMLRTAGRRCVLLGTVETHVGDAVRPSEHTTPESRDVLAVFAEGVRAGCTEAVMEMSSHALEQERVWGIPADVAVFTNLTQDHLDFHGTMERYAAAKARLFAGVGAPGPRVAVINAEDPYARQMRAASAGEVWMYGTEDGRAAAGVAMRDVAFVARDLKLGAAGTEFALRCPAGAARVRTRLVGRVNVLNLLAAMAAAMARGMELESVVEAAGALRPVPGRFELVPGSEAAGFSVIVDYAHTEDALVNLLRLARDLVAAQGGRVITLFGCGGDRDRTKRPKMGRAAAAGSELVVVTSDNPRSEDPVEIINEALLGLRGTGTAFVAEPDRAAAIEVAIRAARVGDLVLLAGKGHEKTQVFADRVVAFDDVAEAARVLRVLQEERA